MYHKFIITYQITQFPDTEKGHIKRWFANDLDIKVIKSLLDDDKKIVRVEIVHIEEIPEAEQVELPFDLL